MLREQETRKEGETVSSLSQVHIFWGLLFFVWVFYIFNGPTFWNTSFHYFNPWYLESL
jgi:hypothetical protein